MHPLPVQKIQTRGDSIRPVASELQDVFDHRFRIGPRNQHIAIHFEFQIEKMSLPGEIRNRLLLAGPATRSRNVARSFSLNGRS